MAHSTAPGWPSRRLSTTICCSGAPCALAITVVFRQESSSRDSFSVATESWLPPNTTNWQPVRCSSTTKRLYSSRA